MSTILRYRTALFNNRKYSANYVVAVQGEFYLVYGTSASSPVSASIFSAINDARLAIGKSTIGFINPTVRALDAVVDPC